MIDDATHSATVSRLQDRIRELEEELARVVEDDRPTDPTGLLPPVIPPPTMPWETNITAKIEALLVETRSNGRELSEIQRRLGDGHEHMAGTDARQDRIEVQLERISNLVETLTNERLEDRKNVTDLLEWRDRWQRRHCEQCIAERAKEA